jgi:transketolase
VDMHTVKPLDTEMIVKCARETGNVFTVEEHSINGGLGSAVAEVIAEREPAALIRLGLRDVFAESGDAELLFDHFQMGAPHVCAAVKQLLSRKR